MDHNNYIKAWRVKRRLTQADLAALLSLNRSAIAKWETGRALPRTDKLLELASTLDCTVEQLLSEDPLKG